MTDIPDFNQWHSPTDWEAVKATGTPGVIFRALSPDGEDALYQQNRRGAESVGLPWIAYGRPLPGTDPVREAGRLNAVIGPLPVGCGLSADLENDSKSGTSWAGDVAGYAAAYLNGIGPASYAPLWYASVNFARTHGVAALGGTWPFWAAHYGVDQPDLTNLPAAILHQYTDRGNFAGISCDLSRLRFGSFADLLYKGEAVPALNIQWLGSPNATAGRQGHDLTVSPSYVVIHTMVGSIESANSRFQNAGQQASAHYGVALDGRIWQWVQEADTAYHAGNWDINLDSIGIEHEDKGDYNGPRTDALYAASAQLVREICQRHGIPISRGAVGSRSGIVAHRECTATACPDALDVDRIVRQAAASPVPVPTPNPAASAGGAGGGMIGYDPINPSDVYQVTIGTDSRFYARKGWDQGLADVDWISLNTAAAPPFAPQSAGIALKPDGKFYTVEAVALDGSIWSHVRDFNGNVLQDWKAKVGTASLPTGAAGPPGPAYDDAELRGELQKLKDRVAAVAKDLS